MKNKIKDITILVMMFCAFMIAGFVAPMEAKEHDQKLDYLEETK